MLMGVNTKRTIASAYGIAALMAGIAGELVAPVTGALATAGSHLGLKAFAIAIVGGLDSITGTLLAGLLLGVAEQYIALYISPGLKRCVGLCPRHRGAHAAAIRSFGDRG